MTWPPGSCRRALLHPSVAAESIRFSSAVSTARTFCASMFWLLRLILTSPTNRMYLSRRANSADLADVHRAGSLFVRRGVDDRLLEDREHVAVLVPRSAIPPVMRRAGASTGPGARTVAKPLSAYVACSVRTFMPSDPSSCASARRRARPHNLLADGLLRARRERPRAVALVEVDADAEEVTAAVVVNQLLGRLHMDVLVRAVEPEKIAAGRFDDRARIDANGRAADESHPTCARNWRATTTPANATANRPMSQRVHAVANESWRKW